MIAAVFTTIHGNREYSHLFGMIRYFELWGEITTVVHTEYSFLVIYINPKKSYMLIIFLEHEDYSILLL